MREPDFDPGLTQQYTGNLRRVVNKDGTFNVHRRGATWRDFHPYLHLLNMSWPGFLGAMFLGYLATNLVFAAGYYLLGPGQLQGADSADGFGRFLNDFFFSSHTLSTVGYGSISPKGTAANLLAAFESLAGLTGFAVATGLLFGRVSRPSAKLGFSDHALVAPYQDGSSLQFRIVNRRPNALMEMEARVMLMTVETVDGQPRRNYQLLRLEREQILFLALTWTVVHPIDQASPLFGLTAADLKRLEAELVVLIKGYDDTFSQTVLMRYSYRHDEIVWGARFSPAFHFDPRGDIVLDLRNTGSFSPTGEAS